VTTDSKGLAPVNYTTSTTAGFLNGKIVATASGLAGFKFYETVTSGPAANISAISGNGQSAAPSTQLAQPLVVSVTDQYGNGVLGIAVTFDDASVGGSFSSNPVSTSSSGVASVTYTSPANPGTGTIRATATGVSARASFTFTVQ
jgi:hypothetical protein